MATYSLLRAHPTPHTTIDDSLINSWKLLTSFTRFAYGRANAAWMMPGLPSYCAGSLLMITSSSTCCSYSCIGLRAILHAHPHNQPNQVYLRYVPSTSYRFLQTPALAADALASRIQFPMNRAWSVTSTDLVCQLRWANKKGSGGNPSPYTTCNVCRCEPKLLAGTNCACQTAVIHSIIVVPERLPELNSLSQNFDFFLRASRSIRW